ncbi:MAG: lipid-binding SYLF domain-containing protein [Thermodesulfobacteriota bacterium]
MKKRLTLSLSAITVIITFLFSLNTASAASKETKRLKDATEVMEAIAAIPEKGIPAALLKKARGIAVMPGVIKLGFVVGGRYGKGVMAVRRGSGWTDPAFLTMGGGSVGWQIGAQSTDIILIFMSKKSVDGIINGKVTLGVDASIAAGPVGRQAEASTDILLKSEIYSYSRSRGLFAGFSFEGGVLVIDDKANEKFYGEKDVTAGDIFAGKVRGVPAAAIKFKKSLME